MSRAARRRDARGRGSRSSRGGSRSLLPVWIITGSVALALLVVATVATRGDASGHHPSPRVASLAPPVVPAARYASNPRIRETYEMASVVPEVLDGVYCYCQCSQHSGHYSLRDCFAGDHAARCDICMNEAVTAYRMTQEGASLDMIRAQIDASYGA